jgi:hypothetical protein
VCSQLTIAEASFESMGYFGIFFLRGGARLGSVRGGEYTGLSVRRTRFSWTVESVSFAALEMCFW